MPAAAEKASVASDGKSDGNLYLGVVAEIARGLLRVGDGLLVALPLAMLIATIVVLLQPLRSWRAEVSVLLAGLIIGLVAGIVLGWFVGKSFVAGCWLTARLRRVALYVLGWSLFIGIIGTIFHDFLVPFSEKIERRIAAEGKRIEEQAKKSVNGSPEKRGAVDLAQDLQNRAAEERRKEAELHAKAESATDPEAKKHLKEAQENARKEAENYHKAAESLATVEDDPKKIAEAVKNATSMFQTNSTSKTVVTGGSPPPVLLRILSLGLPIPGLLGLDWGGFGSKTVRTVIERAYAGNPPSEDELKQILSMLANQSERQAALDKIEIIVKGFHDQKLITDETKWAAFVTALKNIRKNSFKELITGVFELNPPGMPAETVADALYRKLEKILVLSDQGKPQFPSSDRQEEFFGIIKELRPAEANAITEALKQRMGAAK